MSGSCRYVERPDWKLKPPCSSACSSGCRYVAFSAGHWNACGVKENGTVWCAGDNSRGQLGDADFVAPHSWHAVEVKGLPPARDVLVRDFAACAVTELGEVYCWGANSKPCPPGSDCSGAAYVGVGDLGTGSTELEVRRPEPIFGLIGVVKLAANEWATCALKNDGTVWCWGYSRYGGALGEGTVCYLEGCSKRFPLFQVPGVAGATDLAMVETGGCVLTAAGDAWCWGVDFPGQPLPGCPTSGPPAAFLATKMQGLPPLERLASGAGSWSDMAALDELGRVWTWSGRCNSTFQKGFGWHPDDVGPEQRPSHIAFEEVVQAYAFSCGVDGAGDVYCWGYGDTGTLGQGTFEPRYDPWVFVPAAPPQRVALPKAMWIRSSGINVCAGLEDGSVRCWGCSKNYRWGPEGSLHEVPGWIGDGAGCHALPVSVGF
jgi:alpha-tubulin suppressor-like RCC1 family protein